MVLNIAVFSSDAAFNTKDLLNFLDFYKGACPFRIVYFFSDCQNYQASPDYQRFQKYLLKLNPSLKRFDVKEELERRNIQFDVFDIDQFYRNFGYQSKIDGQLSRSEKLRIRNLYNKKLENLLLAFEQTSGLKVDLILLDVYLSVITAPLLRRSILNIHWGDLFRCDRYGNRIYKGFHGVLKSLLNGDRQIYSTAHFVNSEVDGGEIVKLSKPVSVDFARDAELLDFDFPTDPQAAVRFFQDSQNYQKALELEALYEAYLRCYVDSEFMLDCLENLASVLAIAS